MAFKQLIFKKKGSVAGITLKHPKALNNGGAERVGLVTEVVPWDEFDEVIGGAGAEAASELAQVYSRHQMAD